MYEVIVKYDFLKHFKYGKDIKNDVDGTFSLLIYRPTPTEEIKIDINFIHYNE